MTLAVVLVVSAPAAGPIPTMPLLIALLPAFGGALVLPTYTRVSTRRKLSRLFALLAGVGLWAASFLGVVTAAIGAAFIASFGLDPIAHWVGADKADSGVVVGLSVLTGYVAVMFLMMGMALRSVASGSGLVARTSGAFVPGYALLASIIFYALGAVAAFSGLGATAVSVIITLVLFGIGALGRLIYSARRELATARTDLIRAIDVLQIALDHGDATAVRDAGLQLSRSASKTHAMGVRLLTVTTRSCIDALVSHIASVPLPHRKPLEVLANGEFRSLSIEASRRLLHEGCTTIRMHLVES
ncbi:hypothetical protein [Curtobacterium sp. 18060]|uniref:hypothetical protein n=1 Tax=Curtobacterium sp. 18060 TaxID=2681408 RepID=UPI00135A3B11|nr:hypothetical protein [Curtobacterium sp. 18060]